MNPEKGTENRDLPVEAKAVEQRHRLILELKRPYVFSFPHVYESLTVNPFQNMTLATIPTPQRTDAQRS
jgi:hypothetical protein